MSFQKFLQTSIKFFLLLTAITPLVLAREIIFPFIFGKMVFFRSVIEIALILFLVYLLYSFYKNNWKLEIRNWKLFKSPLFILILLFFVSIIISTIFALNPYRAFWGDTERAEGLFGMLHLLVFLIMTVLIFTQKDWSKFFKISLFTGLIVIFYGFLEYIGFFWYPNIVNFPFMALTPSPRPGSYIGNPAFLATYMIFIIMFAVIVWRQSKQIFWKYFSLIMIVLAIAMIFVTGTRGAILGLMAGIFSLLVYFVFKKQSIYIKSISLRKISLFLLMLIILFSSVFWVTRDNAVWQKIPGIDRLAQVISGIDKESTQMRFMNWQIGWQAFKERPILGWGPENYLFAYQENYNPDMAFYGETWLDRAHNKVIDLGVMQGIFGLITYLLMFGGIFYLLFRKQPNYHQLRAEGANYDAKQQISIAPFIMAILIAYFIQNLVLFDQLTSYIPFFAILGFLISASIKQDTVINQELIIKNQLFKKIILSVIVTVVVIVLSYSLYSYNYILYIQAKTFKEASELRKSINITDEEFVSLIKDKIEKAMYPYNFAQYNIRGQGVDSYYLNQFFYHIELIKNPQFGSLADLLIEGQEEIIRKEPYDVRLFIREVEMINPKAANEPELYKKTESLMRQALEIAPKRQELHYNLAFSLSGQERYDESIEVVRYALNLSPNIARAHYHLGLMFFLADNNEEAVKELIIAEELDPSFDNFLPGDLNNIVFIYTDWAQIDKVAELIIKQIDGEITSLSYGFKRGYYEVALRYFAIVHNKESLIKVAFYLTRFKDIKDRMEVLIDLAEKENWEII
ncbi:MAG: O-antigen ligase family protein, partial [Candidatus Paceibacterota bacterium]